MMGERTNNALVRSVIRTGLTQIINNLGQFYQTSHGALVYPIDGLLKECYKDPTPFNISNLSQNLRYIVKELNCAKDTKTTSTSQESSE